MSGEWTSRTIGEVSDAVRVGFVGPTSEHFCSPGEGVKLVRSQNIRPGKLHLDDTAWVTRAFHDANKKSQLQAGDVLITRVGANAGDVCEVPPSVEPLHLSSAVYIRPSQEYRGYVAAYLRSPHGQQKLRNLIVGSVSERINTRAVENLEIPVPPPATAEAIGRILRNFDDHISLNHAMNQTLEDIARAVFKSWFINHDPVHAKAQGEATGLPPEIDAVFPDSFEDDALQVPAGWKTRTFGEFVRVERGLSYKGKHVVEDGKPLLNLGCFGLDATLRQDKMKFYDGDYKDRHVVKPGDLLVANTDMTQDRAILGTPLIVPDELGETLFTHHVYALRPSPKASANLMLWIRFALLQPTFRFEAEGRATGTTVLFMPKDAIEDFVMAVPPPAILEAFAGVVRPMMERQALNVEQSRSLGAMRDLLLPRLVSGELQVPVEAPA